MSLIIKSLKSWFLLHKRSFPWREQSSPYAVWISEIMLQQTRASVVVSYFEKWMQKFPTIFDLANSSIEEVIKTWEGLGYYSRARNIHAGAKQIVLLYNGELPKTEKELQEIKGLGPYTIGAIRSFAFHQKAAAVDGNVIRVLTRYFMLKDDISKQKTVKMLREKTLQLLPNEEPWIVSEALIELGATICNKKASCSKCPIKKGCLSFKQGDVNALPYKSKKIIIEPLYRRILILNYKNHWLIKQVDEGEIMSGLHEFPYIELKNKLEGKEKKVMEKERVVENTFIKKWGIDLLSSKELKAVQHSFTKFRVTLYPVIYKIANQPKISGYKWVKEEKLINLPFSSGHRKIINAII